MDKGGAPKAGWWGTTGVNAPALNLKALPRYAWVYVLNDLGPFRRVFLLLTASSVLVTVLNFAAVYLVGDIVSKIETLSLERILGIYLPLYLGVLLLVEGLDYFLRRYGEAIPAFYADFQRNRFLTALLALDFARSGNVAKERLAALIERYTKNLEGFLDQWFWGISRKLAEAVIVMGILFYQNLVVGGLALVYLAGFLTLAFAISARFAPYAQDYAEESVRESTVRQNFILNLGVVRRFRAGRFLATTVDRFVERKWGSFDRLRGFHARRWFLQLNLFNALFVGTFFYGVFQVKSGALPLGYLVLIRWAFERLWWIVVLFIEYFVALVQQREDARLVMAEFGGLLSAREEAAPLIEVAPDWRELSLVDVTTMFPATVDRAAVRIRVPRFVLRRGAKVGIIGPSGVGKSTVLTMLTNQLPTAGGLRLDGAPLPAGELGAGFITVISNSDPLFKLPLRENVLLGRDVSPTELSRILTGVRANEFYGDGAAVVGSPEFNLSAGQEQRIRLARGLLQASEVYLLDEPFNSVDQATKGEILRFLGDFLRERTVVLVTHNPDDLGWIEELYRFNGEVLEPYPRSVLVRS
jgi:ABC-type multidrug transport system fused ATPase/permease subunit